ncbi:MAG TPA: cytochrome c oxidase subunit II [Symbiobacteriaceae bacterium]|nr:cytochrome c oxidase subunit II [Symbiobacteriaceae bacterium]
MKWRPGRPGRSLKGLLALPALLGLTACTGTPQSMVDPAGPVAETQLHLLTFDLKMVAAIGFVVIALILYVVIRFRQRPGDESLPPQVEGNRKLEIGWTLAAILVLIPLAVEPIGATFALAARPTAADVIHVKVTGHQWWWEIEYPDLGIVTANELVIPAGRQVDLTLTSADVLHSFWAPRLGGKVDLVPGRVNHLWLQGDKVGTYSGQCAELCGTSHANMRLQVVVQEADDYEAWVRARQAPVDLAALGDRAQAGWKLFNDKGCVACHTVNGTTAKGKVGPNLTGVGSRNIIGAGVLETSPESLAQWLHDPQAVKPRAQMPNLNLSPQEIGALAEFLQSLK